MRISDIILIINGTQNFADMRKFFLEAVRVLVPYEKSMFYLVEASGGKISLTDPVFIGVSPQFASAYESSIENTVYGTVAINSHRSIAYRDTDIIPDAVRINSDVYNTFLLPNNVPFGGGIIIANGVTPIAEVTFFRTRPQGDFTPKEVYILDILKQHLEIRLKRQPEPSRDNDDLNLSRRKLRLSRLGLTGREAEIVDMIVKGRDTQEIANALGISVFTVKKHINNLFAKLNVKKRIQLVDFVSSL